MKGLVMLAGVALLAFACAREQGKDTAAVSDMNSGRIVGVVRLQGSLPPSAVEPIKEHDEICGHDVSLHRIAVGKGNGVQDTFVYLDGIQNGRAFPKPESVLVDQKQCRYSPHVMIVPVGTKIDITNSDPILHNVHAWQITDAGMQTVFNIAQPVRGQRTTIEPPLTKPGIVYLSCEAGHAW